MATKRGGKKQKQKKPSANLIKKKMGQWVQETIIQFHTFPQNMK